MNVSGRTKIVGLFGDPVEQSRSPAMHNAAFAALSLDYIYVPFRVRASELRGAVRAIRSLDLIGVNVTVPHKERILPLLDVISPRAKKVGAVNTVVNRNGRLTGDNTDVVGFLLALRSAGIHLRGRLAVVVGAGGAARSVLAALAEVGVGTIRLANRNFGRARRLSRQWSQPVVEPIPLRTLAEPRQLAEAALIVNATSLGWHGEPFSSLAYEATPSNCVFYDLVYGCSTDFLRRAQRAGRKTTDGSGMLLHQGARAFALWTRRRAPLAVMRAALQLTPPRKAGEKLRIDNRGKRR